MIIGSEAMFADLGHFSVRAIQVSKKNNIFILILRKFYLHAWSEICNIISIISFLL